MDAISRGRSRNVAESAIARRAATTTRSLPMPPIAVPVPLKPTPVSPLLRSSSASSFPPSTAGSISPNSSSSSSPDYYGSPPSPPLTLEDQVHVAYAHDDIHTAKILLLRLKGIEVTDNDDPRIAEVQDEDFDFCFAPNGGLVMDIQDEKAMQERQQRELERMEERRRQERLRMCEIKWEREKRRMQEEQLAMRRYREQKRQEEEQRRWRLEEEEMRRQQASQDLHQRRTRSRSDRKVVSYSALWSLPSSPSSSYQSDDDHSGSSAFVYDFMPTPTRKYSRRSNDDGIRPSRSYNDVPVTTRTFHYHRQAAPPIDDAHSVPFADVLKSMQGSLFPVTNEERRMRARRRESLSPSASRSHSQAQRIREDKLMEILLDDTAEGSRTTAKGKGKAIPRRRRSSAEMCATCRSLSIDRLPSTASSSASSSGSRLSWLWFQSSHSRASTSSSLATTPSSASSSPRGSWLKLADAPQSRRLSSISTTSVASSLLSSPSSSLVGGDKSCRCWQKNLTPVDIADCPLTLPSTACGSSTYAAYTSPSNYRCRTTSLPVAATSKGLVQTMSSTVSHGVGQLVELVHGFQQAYVAAAMFSVALSVDGDRWEERKIMYEKEDGVRIVGAHNRRKDGRHAARSRNTFGGLKPRGCRVSAKDVAAFLSVKADGEEENASKAIEAPVFVRKTPSPFTNIALSSPYGAAQAARQPPRGTVLPSPLPYKLFFKPVPPPTRSPFRFNAFSHLHTTYPDGQCGEETKGAGRYLSNPDGDVQLPAWRIRSVGNPAYLRLQALQNAVWQKGMVWEGRGREMSLGGGRDRVVGVAFEGIGCSRLARSAV